MVLVSVFGLALMTRFAVLAWTDGTIDDAFITFRIARNLATGAGVVYNAGERVQATSVLLYVALCSALWRVFGEAAWTVVRVLGGIADAGTAACVAWMAGTALGRMPRRSGGAGGHFDWLSGASAGVLYGCMSTTALMATVGMETGFYTLTIALALLAVGQGHDVAAATLAGVAMLLRPDGALLMVVVAVALGWRRRGIPWRAVAVMLVFAAGRAAFALWYFGSIVPQTVMAKSLLERSAAGQWSFFLHKFFVGRPVVWPLGAAFAAGAWMILRRRAHAGAAAAWALLFVGAFNSFALWYPWYLPPAMIVYAVIVGIGIAAGLRAALACAGMTSRERSVGVAVVGVLAIALLTQTTVYALPGREATGIYMAQRTAIAARIDVLSTPDEVVMLEPLGLVGYLSRRTFYDYPGLASPLVSKALRETGPRVPANPTDPVVMKHVLEGVGPHWLVLRETEYEALRRGRALAEYELVEVFSADARFTRQYRDFQSMYLLKRRGRDR